jgi:hypothetical protein
MKENKQHTSRLYTRFTIVRLIVRFLGGFLFSASFYPFPLHVRLRVLGLVGGFLP